MSEIEWNQIPTLKEVYEKGLFKSRVSRKSNSQSSPQFPCNEKLNEKVSLIQTDITKLKVDAIVNAANESLLGGGGVDGAIHRAAGPGLRRECWDLDGCRTGDAKITKGYDLPAKHVIHTVGPIGEKEGLLRSAYERSFQVMTENKIKSIAFSNISTGVYGYPRTPAGRVALETTRKWLEDHPNLEEVDRIIFCVFEDENKVVYEELLPLYFPPPGSEPDKLDDKDDKEKDQSPQSPYELEDVEKLDNNKKDSSSGHEQEEIDDKGKDQPPSIEPENADNHDNKKKDSSPDYEQKEIDDKENDQPPSNEPEDTDNHDNKKKVSSPGCEQEEIDDNQLPSNEDKEDKEKVQLPSNEQENADNKQNDSPSGNEQKENDGWDG